MKASTTPLAPTSPTNHTATGFNSLPLSPAMLENLIQLGYTHMTPIQAASLPVALAGQDLIAQAKTGSGKTAAYALALLAKLQPSQLVVQAMVLCPTRELADQVTTEIRRLARAEENIKVITLCGGVALRGQSVSLAHGAHIVVGTPGRIQDHIEREHLALDALQTLVLDEADRMLDMGFFDDITKLAAHCPRTRQTLLFSATYPEGIVKISQQLMRNPAQIVLQAQHDASQIRQLWFQLDSGANNPQRLAAVVQLLLHHRPPSTLIFCNTKQQCRNVVELLQQQGFSALALYGELEQRERDQVLVQFANQSCSILVATDVAARGLDIAQLDAVINVDVTPDPEVHIHRIGRTGRGDKSGLVLNLVNMDEMGSVGKIEQLQQQESQWHTLADMPVSNPKPWPARMATLQIVGGRKEKIRAGDVLGALTGEVGLTREQVGKINVNEFSTYVALVREVADSVAQKLSATRVKGKSVKVRLLM